MLHNYTVTLQSKQGPRRFKTQARDISEVITKLKNTLRNGHFHIRSIMRSPK